MNATTILGIASIVVAFVLFSTSFYMAVKGRKQASIGFGLTAFVFMTVIPVSLALFAAVPNPH
ncbi:hypothetical protein GC584_04105 [Corynebacterium sp. zg912]|uniref:Uncharacterized protein n=1 Tax=Corynebacterium wankanglinii TaxID=2735136 RepID=A0A7H0K9U6_9CORY|nr:MULTISPECIES: hypothetical protein [Corynebacterium]MBA1836624.1 hypothetical protein [Corynebacterium wankanglinii]MCR5928623.1 hypothetical protein [Corynebacterium sp. zg912]QNP94062.1 hypothetical protein IA203_00095 [Corynebacterium wankanglinii]